MRTRATIGPGGDHPATAAGIMAALNEGRRWPVFLESEVVLTAPIDLEQVQGGSRFLRLEGRTPGGTVLKRDFTDAESLLHAKNDHPLNTWHLYFTDMIFEGSQVDDAPICEFRNLDRCHFVRSTWRFGGGHGLVLGYPGPPIPDTWEGADVQGTYQVSTSRILDCRFDGNTGDGLRIWSAIDITIRGGGATGNARGLSLHGPPYCTKENERKFTRGPGTILRFNVQQTSGANSIEIDRAYMIRVSNCQVDKPVAFGPNSEAGILDPPISAQISGPDRVPPNDVCRWYAQAMGGSPPYSYQWFRDGLLVSEAEMYEAPTGTSNFGLDLQIRDAFSVLASAWTWVTIDSWAEPCGVIIPP